MIGINKEIFDNVPNGKDIELSESYFINNFGKSKDDTVTLEWLYEKLIYRARFLFFHIFL